MNSADVLISPRSWCDDGCYIAPKPEFNQRDFIRAYAPDGHLTNRIIPINVDNLYERRNHFLLIEFKRYPPNKPCDSLNLAENADTQCVALMRCCEALGGLSRLLYVFHHDSVNEVRVYLYRPNTRSPNKHSSGWHETQVETWTGYYQLVERWIGLATEHPRQFGRRSR